MASATHILDDLTFVGSYFLLLRRIVEADARTNSRKILVTLNDVYILGLFVAVASMVKASIAISHDAFIENTLLHVSYSVSGLNQF
jgi:hypothetical protein